MKNLNVVFCGYRDWADEIFNVVANHKNINVKKIIKSYDEYKIFEEQPKSDIDLILFIGWSWIIPESITDSKLCVGLHPSDLPLYRGGSPLQNQIINGITSSKVSLITLSNKLDAGEIWLKEDLSLLGDSMDDIFDNIVKSSIKILNNFFNDYPNIIPQSQDFLQGSYYKRRTPEQSKISLNEIGDLSLLELYNFIRCLTEPYPNAYIEDESGNKLIFKAVKYIPAKK